MRQNEFPVGPAEAGRTVLRILHDAGEFTHSTARGLVAAGRVRRNGARVTNAADRVESGDRIAVEFDPGTKYREPPRSRPGDGFRVIHEDERMVVVDKSPGLLTIATPGDEEGSLEDLLLASYRRRGFRKPFVRAVHRIDRFTSGLVAFARNETAWRTLREQFSARTPDRVYLAVAEGRIKAKTGTFRHRLDEHPDSLKVRAVPGRRGLDASSNFEVRERFDFATLIEVRLLTGRRNQIRVQFAAEGHPLVGDRTYGHPSPWIPRTALHAWRLSFDDPASGERLSFEAKVPEDFQTLLTALRGGANPALKEWKTRPRGRHSATRTRTPV